MTYCVEATPEAMQWQFNGINPCSAGDEYHKLRNEIQWSQQAEIIGVSGDILRIWSLRQPVNRMSYQWPLLLTWFNFNPIMDK